MWLRYNQIHNLFVRIVCKKASFVGLFWFQYSIGFCCFSRHETLLDKEVLIKECVWLFFLQ